MRTPPSLRAQALALLARREYSRSELRTRLLAHAAKLAGQRAEQASASANVHAHPQAHPGDESDERDEANAAQSASTTTTRTRRRAPDAAAQQAVDEVLDWLAAQRLQSDARYAEARVQQRAASHGGQRIARELAQHGVALAEDATTALRASEFERALALWQRRFGPQLPANVKERARQGNYLLRRGFAAGVVQRVLQGRAAAD